MKVERDSEFELVFEEFYNNKSVWPTYENVLIESREMLTWLMQTDYIGLARGVYLKEGVSVEGVKARVLLGLGC